MRRLSNLEAYRKKLVVKTDKNIDRLNTLETDIKNLLYRMRFDKVKQIQRNLDVIKKNTEDMINT